MLCPYCQRTVPDESRFCLACGRALQPPLSTSNGHGAGVAAGEEARVEVPARKGAWTLSFGAIRDDGVRYRLARWVVQQAPAHPLGEVQESLREGSFFTFLALTPAEADQVRTGIEGLGVPAGLVNLAPASPTAGLEALKRPVARRPRQARSRGGYGQWALLALAATGLALAAWRLVAGPF